MRNDDSTTQQFPPVNDTPHALSPHRHEHLHALKAAMVRGLQAARADIVNEAITNNQLPPEDPEYASDGYIDALNKIILGTGSHYKQAIDNGADFDDVLERMRQAGEWALSEDAKDTVILPEESACYRMFCGALEAGIEHLDPQNKRFHLSATAGDAVVSLNGADLASRQAMYMETLLQNYQHHFNQQGVEIEHDEHALAELDPEELYPVKFAHKGMVSDAELRACIDDALKHTFCLYRDKTKEYDDSSIKEDLLERNSTTYKDLREQVAQSVNEEGALPPLQVIMDTLDHMLSRDFLSRPHDLHEPFHATWVSDFISYLQDMVKVNAGKDDGSDPQSANYLLAEFENMQQLIDAYPRVRKECHKILCQQLGETYDRTAHEAFAAKHGLDLDTLDEDEYDDMNCHIVEGLQNYMGSQFFDRVNSMHLRDKDGPISLDFNYDEKGNKLTFLPHSYALVHRAYDMAETVTSDKMKGTQMYDRQLQKNQDYFLSALAYSNAWQCQYPDQYDYAKQVLMHAYEDKRVGRGAGL